MNLVQRWNALHPGLKLTLLAAVLWAAAWSAYRLGDGSWTGERASLVAAKADLDGRTSTAKSRIKKRSTQEDELQAFANQTLGADHATVDSELRSRLNRLGEELKLGGFAVNTGEVTSRPSPRRSAFNGAGRSKLRNETDFTEVKATISGEGSIDKVLRLVHRIEAEPWIKRIDGLTIDPTKEGESQKVQVKLTTLFMPGRKPDPKAPQAPYDPASFDRFLALVETNPFRVPPPPADPPPPVPTVAQQAPTPAGFPWHDWIVAMVALGPDGWEVGLRNVVSNETRRLLPGDGFAEVKLIGVTGDVAEFQLADQKFAVTVGSKLSDRTPIVR